MVRVSSSQMTVYQEDGDYKFIPTPVHYSASNSQFHINLPDHYKQTLDQDKVYGSSEKAVRESFLELGKKYAQIIRSTTCRKVICLRFEAKMEMTLGDEEVKIGERWHRSGSEIEMTFDYKIRFEVTFKDSNQHGERTQYFKEDPREHLGLKEASTDYNEVIVDWTEDREEFFKNTREGLGILIKNIWDFRNTVSKDQKNLEKIIKTMPLLPAPKGGK